MAILDFFRRSGAPLALPQAFDRSERQPLVRKGRPEILESYSTIPELRAIVHATSSATAAVGWRLHRVPISGASRGHRSGSLQRRAAERRNNDAVEIDQHPFLDLLDQPTPLLSGRVARQTTVASLDLIGEAVWLITRLPDGTPASCHPMPGTVIVERPTATNPTWGIRLPRGNGSVVHYHVDDVLFFVDPDVADPYGPGSGLGLTLADELDVLEHSTKTVAQWFANFAMPATAVSVVGASEIALAKVKTDWKSKFQGFRKFFAPLFVNGDLKVTRLDTSFKDQALIEVRKSFAETIRITYGVPPEKIGATLGSVRAGSDAADRIFATGVVVPRLEILREQFQKLADQFGPGLVVDYESPIPEDLTEKRAAMVGLRGAWTIDEERAAFGDGALEPGIRLVPSGLIEVAQEPELTSIAPEPIRKRAWIDRSTELAISSLVSTSSLLKIAAPEVKRAARNAGTVALQEAAPTSEFDGDSNRMADKIQESQNAAANRLSRRMTESLRQAVTASNALGLTTEQLREAVTQSLDDARAFAAQEAQAVTTTVTQAAELEAYRQVEAATGLVIKKQWLDTSDGRTREAHVALGDLEPIGLDEQFEVPEGEHQGKRADGPGGFGIAALDRNCRCAITTITVAPGERAIPIGRGERAYQWRRKSEARDVAAAKIARAYKEEIDHVEEAIMELLGEAAKAPASGMA